MKKCVYQRSNHMFPRSTIPRAQRYQGYVFSGSYIPRFPIIPVFYSYSSLYPGPQNNMFRVLNIKCSHNIKVITPKGPIVHASIFPFLNHLSYIGSQENYPWGTWCTRYTLDGVPDHCRAKLHIHSHTLQII